MLRQGALLGLALATGACATFDTRSRACRSVATLPLGCTVDRVKAEVYSPAFGTAVRASTPSAVCIARCDELFVMCSERRGLWGCHGVKLNAEDCPFTGR